MQLCYDRIVPEKHRASAAKRAIAENPANAPDAFYRPGVAHHPALAAQLTGKRWATGRALGVRFLDGSAKQRVLTQRFAETWLQHANLRLRFASVGDAEIRVSFRADPGTWSAVGTDALEPHGFAPAGPTMNLGWLRDDTDAREWKRCVLHQFGHALGMVHEHPVKNTSARWKAPSVHAYFGTAPTAYNRAEVRENVLRRYSVEQRNGVTRDVDSVMLYSVPAELLKDGKTTRSNDDLSTSDKARAALWYPR